MRRTLFAGLAAAALLLSLVPIGGSKAQPSPVAVIMSANASIANITRGQLQRVFLAQPSEYGNGRRFVPLNGAAGSRERTLFDRRVLGMEPNEVAPFWVDQRIRGHRTAPRAIPSAALTVRLVARLPGGIAYVPLSAVNASVKVLSIDGKNPTDRDYLLR